MEKRKGQRMRATDYFDQKRTCLRQFFSVFDRIDGQPVGYVVDISVGGMMMIGREPIKAGTIMKMRIELPEVAEGNGRLTVDGRAIWCKKEDDPECYYTGFEFMMISPEQAGMIENLINRYAPVDSTQNMP